MEENLMTWFDPNLRMVSARLLYSPEMTSFRQKTPRYPRPPQLPGHTTPKPSFRGQLPIGSSKVDLQIVQTFLTEEQIKNSKA